MAFSQAELRSAFRQLAREQHPDRHPDASSAEAAQWSGSFAEVERRYRRLAAALAARH
jgi:DnaJ-class molecular chaperone